jgi:hypothetical protein
MVGPARFTSGSAKCCKNEAMVYCLFGAAFTLVIPDKTGNYHF